MGSQQGLVAMQDIVEGADGDKTLASRIPRDAIIIDDGETRKEEQGACNQRQAMEPDSFSNAAYHFGIILVVSMRDPRGRSLGQGFLRHAVHPSLDALVRPSGPHRVLKALPPSYAYSTPSSLRRNAAPRAHRPLFSDGSFSLGNWRDK